MTELDHYGTLRADVVVKVSGKGAPGRYVVQSLRRLADETVIVDVYGGSPGRERLRTFDVARCSVDRKATKAHQRRKAAIAAERAAVAALRKRQR